LDFLATSLNNVPARQQSLRVVFEGSWSLLTKEEQNVLGKLSVFRGGFTSESARKIANATLMMLARLVDKSLLRISGGRYYQHPLLRSFTEEKLAEHPDEGAGTRVTHAAYFLALAEQAEPYLITAQQVVWLDRLEVELDNLRAALEWFFIQKDEVECGLRLASSLLRFWLDHSRVNEGRNWLEEGLARSKDKRSLYAKFRHAAGTLARRQGDFASAHTHLEESLLASRGANDKVREAKTLGNLAYTIAEEGDLETAERYMRQSLEIYQTLNDEWGIAITLGNLANILCDQGNYKAGRKLYEQCLYLLRELKDDLRIVGTLTGLGLVALDESDYVSARAYAEEALALQRQLGDRDKISLSLLLTVLGRVAYAESDCSRALTLFQESLTLRSQHGEKPGIILSLEDIARVIRQDDSPRATSLWSSVEKFRQELGFPRPPVESARYAVELEKIKMVLEDKKFASAWVKGQVIGLEQAITLALQHEV
jgi:tetratricopeptide (TPR) repeat protein